MTISFASNRAFLCFFLNPSPEFIRTPNGFMWVDCFEVPQPWRDSQLLSCREAGGPFAKPQRRLPRS